MSQATFSVDQILKTPFPSYHQPLELARALNRSGDEAKRTHGISAAGGPAQAVSPRARHRPGIRPRAHRKRPSTTGPSSPCKALENTFANLDEETLCRWGRLFKDRGDDYLELPGAVSNRFAPNRDMAIEFYRKSLEKYDQAYRIRFGYYPGINKATLLLIVGSLKAAADRSGGRPLDRNLLESEELAGKLLESRASWRVDHPDDETIWHPATAGEAHLLRQEWTQAADLYREATEGAGTSTTTPANRCTARSSASSRPFGTWASRSRRRSTTRPRSSHRDKAPHLARASGPSARPAPSSAGAGRASDPGAARSGPPA